MQHVLYSVFLASCFLATLLGLLLVWGLVGAPDAFYFRLLATCIIFAVATAFTMSATRLVQGRASEDDRG